MQTPPPPFCATCRVNPLSRAADSGLNRSRWVRYFGPTIAADLRRRRPKPHSTWHLDEVFIRIDGRLVYLWRAVDAEGEVLDVVVQSKRDKRAALKLLRNLLKKMAFVPDKLVTDDLRSYGGPPVSSGCLVVAMNAGDGAITERRTRINRPDDGRGSRVWDQPNDFCPSTPPPTTPSTSSVTSSQRRHTGHSEPRPCRRGAR